jgi:hypothetical protein
VLSRAMLRAVFTPAPLVCDCRTVYFKNAGADLKSYSSLRDLPCLGH